MPPLIAEEDASNMGVGDMLLQWSAMNGKTHPCAFFSSKLSQAECNYGVEDEKLHIIKLALKEWMVHGTQSMDHKTLQYIWDATQLNLRQATWVVFFNHFDFVVTSPPLSLKKKNGNAMSHQFDLHAKNPSQIM